jgi:hypothetical protein
MQKTLSLILLIIVLFHLSSCDESSSQGMPSALEVILNPTLDYYLMIEVEEYEDETLLNYVYLVSKQALSSMSLDGSDLTISSISYDGRSGYYSYNLMPEDGNFGEQLSVELVYSARTITSSIQMPPRIIMDPPAFDPANDWNLEWELQQDPDLQYFLQWYRAEDNSYVSKYDELDPQVRDYSVPRSTWEILDDIRSAEFGLEAQNFKFHEGGFISIISAYDYYQMPVSVQSRSQWRFQRVLKLCERLQYEKEGSR